MYAIALILPITSTVTHRWASHLNLTKFPPPSLQQRLQLQHDLLHIFYLVVPIYRAY